jgi:NAD(P)-dependent dehydrogenase (short-subunit alcohol dehydrogenase family)
MHIDERPARDGTSCVNSCARPQVAKSIAFLLSEEHAAMVHGAQLPIDGGFWVS